MLATLGIEHDNDSDENFVADEEEESHSSDRSDAEERDASTNQPGKMSRQPAKRAVRPTLKPQKSIQSTHDRLPPPVKKRKLMNLTSTTDGGECGDIMESDEAGGDVTSYSLVDSEYQPHKRKSKHLEEMDTMLEGTDEIENIVPPFNPTSCLESWASFEESFAKYKKKYNLKFRVRNSVKTVHYNSTNEDQIPTEFEWTQRIFRCTHGVSQKSRSKGHRNRRKRYKKCKARLTAVVKRIAANKYEITIQNQVNTSK
ncbi:hypothetical protein DVH05_021045 [Phytophthora capsici]|nr:hypothetical protein DVH05_021045 [Phytophthora capsici]